jgi:hypothetical protein
MPLGAAGVAISFSHPAAANVRSDNNPTADSNRPCANRRDSSFH